MRLDGRRVDRFTAIKSLAGSFIRRREGDRVGLIVFGEKTYLVAPLTFDVQAVEGFLAHLWSADTTLVEDAAAAFFERMWTPAGVSAICASLPFDEKVELEVASESGQIQRVILIDSQSNRTEFRFSEIRENLDVSDAQFRFAIPTGVEVVLAPSDPPL